MYRKWPSLASSHMSSIFSCAAGVLNEEKRKAEKAYFERVVEEGESEFPN